MGRYDLRLSEPEFWSLTPREFQMLMDRHRDDILWQETLFAIQPMLYAERHRDEKRRRTAYVLNDFTLTGMAKAARRIQRQAEKAAEPEGIFKKISRIFGGG